MTLRLQAVGLVIGAALALTAASSKAEDVMFRVDYVRTEHAGRRCRSARRERTRSP